ncbi:MAG: CRISPR-associated endonuclease Cas2 [Deltaproteobacteria bacterium]|nr:MAG: CRISPR-associated endonuclease Cas2 [Deltaproteobacteria bacterium]
MERTLYIVAYDISDERRLNRVRQFLKAFSTGGQKSVYECFLTEGELREVWSGLNELIDHEQDKVHCFRLDAHSRVHTLGIAVPPRDPDFFCFG